MTECVYKAIQERAKRNDVRIAFIKCYERTRSPRYIELPVYTNITDKGVQILWLKNDKHPEKGLEVVLTIPREHIEDMMLTKK